MSQPIPVFQRDAKLHYYNPPIPPGEAMHLHYYCRHLPTGNVYLRDSYFVNLAAFHFCLKHWGSDRSRSDTWLYAETEEEVNMPVARALIAQGIAAHMWHNLPKDSLNLVKLEHKEAGKLLFTLDARRCGRLVNGKPVLTGGAEVTVLLRNARYTPWAMEQKTFRLARGWDEGQYKLAVIRAYHWGHAGLVRMEAAEALWDDVNRLQGRAGFSEAVAAWEKQYGESRAYSKMTLEEIAGWQALVKQWEQENPPCD
jgi:hypothetical protein